MSQVPPIVRGPVFDAVPDTRGMLGSRVAAFCVDFIAIGIIWLAFVVVLLMYGRPPLRKSDLKLRLQRLGAVMYPACFARAPLPAGPYG